MYAWLHWSRGASRNGRARAVCGEEPWARQGRLFWCGRPSVRAPETRSGGSLMPGHVWCPRGSAVILALTLAVLVAPIITSAQAGTVTVTGQVAWCRSVPLPLASALDFDGA